jgi:uncharacterized protein
MSSFELVKSVLAGTIAGVASGFLGVSPGGILVPVISLLLPFSQHVVQGISLLAQAPPTSLSGLSVYSGKGRQVAVSQVLIVATGFIIGGPIGAMLARLCTDRQLRWMFVCYLLLLVVLATVKKSKVRDSVVQTRHAERHSLIALVVIGMIAGTSSGLLGIGGGLAITALSVVVLRKKQHEAQALSLAITMLPLTLPAAWVYMRQGWHLPWLVIVGLVVGLAGGNWVGAGFANRLSEHKLRIAFAAILLAMAGYMVVIAIQS